jgi:hypothetical protein
MAYNKIRRQEMHNNILARNLMKLGHLPDREGDDITFLDAF